MAKQRYDVLILMVLMLTFLGASATAKSPDAKIKSSDAVDATLLVLNKGSRAQLGSQRLVLNGSGSAEQVNLEVGALLQGYSLKLVSRKVLVDSKTKLLWIEVTLLDQSKKVTAYLTATVPAEKFSVGVGFANPKDLREQLVLMIDTTSL